MNTHGLKIVVNRVCPDIYDFSLIEFGEVITVDLDDIDMEEKYVIAVDKHADLFIDEDQDTVDYFIENGIAAICYK